MNNAPLMPKATAVWLVENTALTFEQIGEFCKIHVLEVKAIADGEAGVMVRGHNPVMSGQLTREEIAKAEQNPAHRLQLAKSKVHLPEKKKTKGARYTPLSRRHDRPNAILWLLRHHPELKDAQIIRLIGTTKSTVQAVRERTHWNSAQLVPMDPVTLSLCSQIDLDFEVTRATEARDQQRGARGQTLIPAAVTTAREDDDVGEDLGTDEGHDPGDEANLTDVADADMHDATQDDKLQEEQAQEERAHNAHQHTATA